MACKSTLLKAPTSRKRRVSIKSLCATDDELWNAFNGQLELPFVHYHTNGNSKTSVILDVTGRTDTIQGGGLFAGQYCFCKGGCVC